jgi:hypothetical protein
VTTELKKGAVRGAKVDPRGTVAKTGERSAVGKRPSAPPPALDTALAKRRERVASEGEADNDNDEDELELEAETPRKPVVPAIPGNPGPRRGLPTGSLHTEAREPAQAQALKQRLTALMNAQQRLGELKRSAHKHFYEVGEVLRKIRDERLFEVKGYSSLDAFVEREVQLGAQFCRDAVRVHELFQQDAAQAYGLARLSAALRALEDEPSGVTALDQIPGARTAIPPHKL